MLMVGILLGMVKLLSHRAHRGTARKIENRKLNGEQQALPNAKRRATLPKTQFSLFLAVPQFSSV
jgi:hypothetical protein